MQIDDNYFARTHKKAFQIHNMLFVFILVRTLFSCTSEKRERVRVKAGKEFTVCNCYLLTNRYLFHLLTRKKDNKL